MRDAIVRVGTLDVAGLILSTEVMRIFYGVPENQLDLTSFWAHVLWTACYSRLLAMGGGVNTPAELWVGGLLHDMGKLLVVRQAPVEYGEIITRAAAGMPLLEAETERLGFTHAQAGAALLERWRLPAVLVECASGHHEEYADLATPQAVVAAANALANAEMDADTLPGMTAAEGEGMRGKAERLYESYRRRFAEYVG